jgi:Tol biopolymer transport system component
MKSFLSLFLILSLNFSISSAQQKQITGLELSGPYLGQSPPTDEPKVFAPGIVSDGMHNRDITISADGKEIYFCSAAGNYNYSAIFVTKLINGKWTLPESLPFASDPRYINLEPALSPDGKKLFFLSNRPDTENGETVNDQDIWVSERQGDQWGKPYNLGAPVNTDAGEFFPSVTNDGALYFTRDDKQTRKNFIYRSRFVNGKYTEPEKLGEEINSGQSQYNAFIAPDESFIIVPVFGRSDSKGGTDYYIVYRTPDDKWSAPINLGDKINTAQTQEWSPYVSPDGKYFFFMSTRLNSERESGKIPLTFDELKNIHNSPQNGNSDIYWISTRFINELKPVGWK